jgi:DedD protein
MVWLVPWVLDGPQSGVETASSSLQLPTAEEPMPMRTQTLQLGDAVEPAEPAPVPAAIAPAPKTAEPARAEAALEPRPDDTNDEPPPVVAAARPEVERDAPAAKPPPTAPATPPKPAPAVAATGDWIVQLGSFGEEANARRLAQRAGTFGYKADVSSYRSGGRTLYRVRVGPQRTRGEADAAASALRAHGLNDARVVAAR